MTTVDAAILDLGGVMTEPPFRLPRSADDAVLALAAYFLAELRDVYPVPDADHDFLLLETGRLSEADFVDRLCDRYAAATGTPRLESRRVRAGLLGGAPVAVPEMVDAVREVRAGGVATALLTNNAREWEPRWRACIPVDELFEVVVDSSRVGVRKPDPRIFRITCERLGVEPERCLFVDDLRCNVDAARELGMETILCREPAAVASEVRDRALGRAAGGARR